MSSTEQRNGVPVSPAEIEVREKRKKPPYTADYKRRIVEEFKATPRGSKGALLRREGLYATTVNGWIKDQETSLEPRKRGPKASPDTALRKENDKLRRENERLKVKLEHAALILSVQKKVARMFDRSTDENEES